MSTTAQGTRTGFASGKRPLDIPPGWQMTLYSLPAPGIEPWDNTGGGAKITPICASTQ